MVFGPCVKFQHAVAIKSKVQRLSYDLSSMSNVCERKKQTHRRYRYFFYPIHISILPMFACSISSIALFKFVPAAVYFT